MTSATLLTFCAGFFAGVVALAVAEAIDPEAQPGRAALTLRQGAWTIAITASVMAIVVALSNA